MSTSDRFPLIEISGEPFERGLMYGEVAADRIAQSVAIYATATQSMDRDGQLAQSLLEVHDAILSFDPAYVEEMKGIAQGAGVSYEDILLINARTEIVGLARKGAVRGADECTSVAVLPERAAEGKYFQGQNWDNRVACADTAIVLKVVMPDGLRLLTFVEAGGMARYGMNSSGVCLNANGLESDRDYRQSGVPLSLIRRKALEQDHFTPALQVIVSTPKTCSCNVLLGTKDGFAVNIECAPDESFITYPDGGTAVHANHWVNPGALAKLKDTGLSTMTDSVMRQWRITQLINNRGARIAVDQLKTYFSDTFGSPYSLCRPERHNTFGDLVATTATVILRPQDGVMEVARMPYKTADYIEYTI